MLSPAAGAASPVRYHSLDAVRAFAMLLGIVFHASLSFLPVDIGWATMDRSTSVAVTVFVVISHSFRLGVFFLIAGFFARLVCEKRGLGGFVRQRLQRILLPFLLGWLLVRPLIVSGWVWAQIEPEQGGFPEALGFSYILLLRSLRPSETIFTGTHLWFLYYLLLVYAAFLLLRAGLVLPLDRNGKWRARLDGLFRRVVSSAWSPLLLAAPTVLWIWGMREYGVDTPDKTLVPHVSVLLLYGFQFSLGWLLHRQPGLLAELRGRWRSRLLLALPASALVMVFTLGLVPAEQVGAFWLRLVSNGAYALMMWLWILGCIGFFARFFDNPRPAWRYVADSSYWLYIIHLHLVVWMQVALTDLTLHWSLKWVIILAAVSPVLFLSYHYLVRSTFVGALLNGRRYPFRPLILRGAGDANQP